MGIKLGILNSLIFSAFIFNFEKHFVKAEQLNLPGNVTVVGLFEIYEPQNGQCGAEVIFPSVMAAEAVKWFFQRLNTAGEIPIHIAYCKAVSFFPKNIIEIKSGFHSMVLCSKTDSKHGLEGYQTCRHDGRAVEIAVDVLYRSLNNDQDTIIGVIGPEFSSEAEAVLPVLSSVDEDFRLLTVGYSTTAENLNNNVYPNFFRVVPNDNLQVELMVQSMVIMHWSRIAILYEDYTYGQHAMQSLTNRSLQSDICIAYTASINVDNGINSEEIERISRDLLIGTSDRPSIQGFVFFGTDSTINLFLQQINSLGISNIPIGIFPDSINMDLDAFMDHNKVIGKTMGSLITSPTYRFVDEFQDHWKDVFTNDTTFRLENLTNPWLYVVYETLKPCDKALGTCDFSPLTDGEFKISFPEQPLYVQYALIAAHAIAKTLSDLYRNYCPGNSDPCNFVDNFQPGHMIQTMADVQLNFDTDFTVRLQSLSGVQMSFTDAGEANLGMTTPSYQLFNLRLANINDGTVTFAKIGDMINGQMVLNTNNIIDYPDGRAANVWPNVRKGQCGVDKFCGECIPTDLPYWYIHDPGDLYIVGMVPIFDKSGNQDCGTIRTLNGYQLVEAIRFAAQKFNERSGTYSNYFQNATIGVIILNTCNNPTVIQRKILNLQKDGLYLPNGKLMKMEDRILGYAGPLGSTVSIAVSGVLDNLQKVLVSYASTSSTLSNRQSHKYFMRVVSPNDKQANAMANILEQLNANYVQALFSEGAYGENGIATLQQILRSKGVCIIQSIKVPESDNYNVYYEYLRKYPHAKIVIIFLRSHVVRPLMEILTEQMDKGEFIFIGSEAWGKNTDLLDNDSKQALLGSYSVVVEMAEDNELLSYVQKLKPQTFSMNPWSQQYLQNRWQCYYNISYDKRYPSSCEENFSAQTTLNGWSTPAYYSVLSILIGSSTFLGTTCGNEATVLCEDYLNNPSGLVNEIKSKVKLDIYGNGIPEKLFNENGDGNVGYAIYNIQKDDDNPQLLQYKKVGQYPLVGTFTFEKSLIVFPTSEELISRCPNDQACSGCVSSETGGTIDTEDGGIDVWIIVLLVLFLISLGAAVTLAILFYRLRKQKEKDHEIYLTPATPAEERQSTNYHVMSDLERPAAVGESDEICPEPPHTSFKDFMAEKKDIQPTSF